MTPPRMDECPIAAEETPLHVDCSRAEQHPQRTYVSSANSTIDTYTLIHDVRKERTERGRAQIKTFGREHSK